jgi:DNA-3-methyladenine glycosylase II
VITSTVVEGATTVVVVVLAVVVGVVGGDVGGRWNRAQAESAITRTRILATIMDHDAIGPLSARSFEAIARRLASSDPLLGGVVGDFGIPAFWQRRTGISTLARLIIEQQVSLASADAVYRRLARRVRVTAGALARLDEAGRVAVGLTRQKARYLRELGTAVVEGRLDLGELPSLDDHRARAVLRTVPGIGPWTADTYLLSALRRPDIWPEGDRALVVGTAELAGRRGLGPAEAREIARAWRPQRAVAARLIWHSYLARRGRA